MQFEDGVYQSLREVQGDVAVQAALQEELPPQLEEVINGLAVTGTTPYDWADLRPLVRRKIIAVLGRFFVAKGFVGPVFDSFDSRLQEILALLERYDREPPFTLQRLAEVLVQAPKEYRTTHALMNGLVKLLSVTILTVDYEAGLEFV